MFRPTPSEPPLEPPEALLPDLDTKRWDEIRKGVIDERAGSCRLVAEAVSESDRAITILSLLASGDIDPAKVRHDHGGVDATMAALYAASLTEIIRDYIGSTEIVREETDRRYADEQHNPRGVTP